MILPGEKGFLLVFAIIALLVFPPGHGHCRDLRGKLKKEKARLIELKKEQEKAKKELERTIRIQRKLKKDVTYLKRRLEAKKRFLRRIERELEYVNKLLSRYSAKVDAISDAKERLEKAALSVGSSLARINSTPAVTIEEILLKERAGYGMSAVLKELLSARRKLAMEEELVSRKLEKLEDTREYWEKKEKATLTKKKRIDRIKKKRERELRELSRKRKAIERKYAKLRRDIQSLQKVIINIEKKAKKARRRPLKKISPKGLTYPTRGIVVSRFGRVKDKNFDVYIDNKGVEIKGKAGGEIRAVGDGVVVYQGNVSSFGLVTVIEHDGEIFSVYGKAEVYNVKVGDRVRKGQRIGKLNRRGLPILYFELRIGGKPVNPLKYIRIPRS